LEWGPGRKLGSRKLFALSAGVVVSFDTDSEEGDCLQIITLRFLIIIFTQNL